MAFTKEERDLFHLHGLIPPHIGSLAEQKKRSYYAFKSKATNLEKYIYLRDLQDSNETLFYSLLQDCLDEMLPIVYTPTVGQGCQEFSRIYRRPRGLFISYPFQDRMEQMLSHERFDPVDVIVATDGERILGLGDLGVGGMGISIGKLALYTACAGIHPSRTLPIVLDVGTDNEELINDPLYIGWRHKRIRGKAYDQFMDRFVKTVQKRFPNVLLQWEDFAKHNATTILERYQNEMCTFNDDIQGTASVVLATFLAAIKNSELPLINHRIVVVGGGSAGCGISNLILGIMKRVGIDEAEALKNIFIVDRYGLLTEKNPHILPFQRKFCKTISTLEKWKIANIDDITLKEVVDHIKPTVLIGVTGRAGIFTREIIQTMANHVKRPIIFPLSNPNTCVEALPEQIMKWTRGKAMIGTGSPFPPVVKDGKLFRIDQTNNSYIFPGLGLGVLAVKAKKITESMFLVAAETLAKMSPAIKDPEANLLPPIRKSREIAFKIATAVAKEAMRCKVARPQTPAALKNHILEMMWRPSYYSYEKKVHKDK